MRSSGGREPSSRPYTIGSSHANVVKPRTGSISPYSGLVSTRNRVELGKMAALTIRVDPDLLVRASESGGFWMAMGL
jgi:hypothetical protein